MPENLTLHAAVRRAKKLARGAEDFTQRALATIGAKQPETRISADAQAYWRQPSGDRWQGNSHWKDAAVFDGGDLWSRIGAEHLDLFDAGARMAGFTRPWKRVLEWGCGGGANAVHFAPRADEFIGVDISPETLRECEKQVRAACDTPFRAIEIDVAEPEAAIPQVEGRCDVFVSFYVFELIPSPEYGERLLRIASEVLAPGGLALIQIKYDAGHWRTKPRRRAYRSGLAEMTTYPIDEFWQLAERCGLTPRAIHLVPKNELDERYAYFFLSKPE
ncbi:class I SAM-dependent methyltransferase [Amycolatopsis plumensis]|uniref:Class I SAM-dependent methyltransferase n=1 Tax=Amycolatopsis plumensis TaxID=236508 RepID=A0ABV5ULX4_9PSEU